MPPASKKNHPPLTAVGPSTNGGESVAGSDKNSNTPASAELEATSTDREKRRTTRSRSAALVPPVPSIASPSSDAASSAANYEGVVIGSTEGQKGDSKQKKIDKKKRTSITRSQNALAIAPPAPSVESPSSGSIHPQKAASVKVATSANAVVDAEQDNISDKSINTNVEKSSINSKEKRTTRSQKATNAPVAPTPSQKAAPSAPTRKPRRSKDEMIIFREEKRLAAEKKQAEGIEKAAVAAEAKRVAEEKKKEAERDRKKDMDKLELMEKKMLDKRRISGGSQVLPKQSEDVELLARHDELAENSKPNERRKAKEKKVLCEQAELEVVQAEYDNDDVHDSDCERPEVSVNDEELESIGSGTYGPEQDSESALTKDSDPIVLVVGADSEKDEDIQSDVDLAESSSDSGAEGRLGTAFNLIPPSDEYMPLDPKSPDGPGGFDSEVKRAITNPSLPRAGATSSLVSKSVTLTKSASKGNIGQGKRKVVDIEESQGIDNTRAEGNTPNLQATGCMSKRIKTAGVDKKRTSDVSLVDTTTVINNWRLTVQKQSSKKGKFLSPASAASSQRGISPGAVSDNGTNYSSFGGMSREASVEPASQASTVAVNDPESDDRRVTSNTTVKISDSEKSLVGRKSRICVKKEVSDGGSTRGEKKIRVNMSNIEVDKALFRDSLVPTYFDFRMSRADVFATRVLELLEGLQEIYDLIFGHVSKKLTYLSAVKIVADQRFMEYRRKIAEAAIRFVKEFFERMQKSNPMFDDEWRIGYVERAVQNATNPDFVWRSFPLQNSDESWDKRGMFLNELVLKTLSVHFVEIRDSRPDSPTVLKNEPPIGALALSACAVERALKCWSSGSFVEDSQNFSNDAVGGRVALFHKIAAGPPGMEPFQWRKVIGASMELAKAHHTSRASVGPSEDSEMIDLTGENVVDPANLAALDQDSDSDLEGSKE